MIARNYRKGILVASAVTLMLGSGWWLGSWLIEQRQSQRYNAAVNDIINLMQIPDDAGPATKFDVVRDFIHLHSRHKANAALKKMRGRGDLFAEGMLAHALGKSSEPVHMECSTRSNLMGNVLRRLGYKTRVVYVFDTDAKSDGKLRSHTFIDIFNPATKKWESHDPDYNFYWRAVSGDRLSVFEAAENLSEIEPCDQTRCGWDLVSDEGQKIGKVRDLIDIVSIVDKANNQRISRFTTRANPNTEFSFYDEKGNFCEIFAKFCTDIIRSDLSGAD